MSMKEIHVCIELAEDVSKTLARENHLSFTVTVSKSRGAGMTGAKSAIYNCLVLMDGSC